MKAGLQITAKLDMLKMWEKVFAAEFDRTFPIQKIFVDKTMKGWRHRVADSKPRISRWLLKPKRLRPPTEGGWARFTKCEGWAHIVKH